MAIRPERRLGAPITGLVTGALLSLLVGGLVYARSDALGSASVPPALAPRARTPAFGLDDHDVFVYIEAVTLIKDKAVRLRRDVTRAEIVEESLRAYLSLHAPCCAYLGREEYRRFKESLNEHYVGIGMEIKRERDGRTVCLPHPDSPASRAGIKRGDELRSIDGVRVHGKPILTVAPMARGRPGSEVTVAVAAKDGRERQFRIARSPVSLPSLSTRSVEGRPVILLSAFTRDTQRAMTHALRNWPADVPIIIDLRGNGGGDLHAAIDTAMLFLEEGKRIVSVDTRQGTRLYESRAGGVNRANPVYVWQDEGTASAAEVFIAALTDNARAVSIGTTTAGKGTWEEIVELSNGSALILAIGHLRTPRGVRYEGRGLKPSYSVRDGDDTMTYLMKVREASAAGRRTHLQDVGRWNGRRGGSVAHGIHEVAQSDRAILTR